MVASGLAILRGAALPRWLGWAAIVIGILALVLPIAFLALLLLLIWILVVSILIYRRQASPADGGVIPGADEGGLASSS
jgi:hypothetical protein